MTLIKDVKVPCLCVSVNRELVLNVGTSRTVLGFVSDGARQTMGSVFGTRQNWALDYVQDAISRKVRTS